jgi:hypothetical protein
MTIAYRDATDEDVPAIVRLLADHVGFKMRL